MEQTIRADCLYTRQALALALGVSEQTLDRLLADLGIQPYRLRSACCLISGRTVLEAVERRCQK